MRILDISPRFPYPLIDGGRRGIYYPLRALVRRGHTVHLASLTGEEDPASVNEVSKVFAVDVVVSQKKPSMCGAFISLRRSTPYQVSRFHNQELLDRARSLLHSLSYDIIQVEGIHAAYYARLLGPEHDIPTVMRLHDMLSLNLARSIEYTANPLMKLWLRYDGRRLQEYEKASYERIGSNLVISDVERDLVLAVAPNARCDVIPAGVDLDEFEPGQAREDFRSILWLGSLHWAANRKSFWWFYREIVPLIIKGYPDAKIRVAGTGTPPEVFAVRHPNVEILGFVQDVRGLMACSQVCVVPLQVGSGVRIKLLEMFAMRRAVVSTTVGAEGLCVTDGEQALIADSPEAFAESVGRLIEDATLRERLGRKARQHVEQHYTWDKIAGKIEEVYRSLCSRR